MKKFSLSSFFPLFLLGGILLFQGCKDPTANPAAQMQGTWHTYYYPEVIYETDYCYGTLSPMAVETWDITWEITATSTREVEITMTCAPSNFIVTDFTCGSSTGIIPENMPIEHLYAYIDGNRLRVADQDNTFGSKLYNGVLNYQSTRLSGNFTIDTYSASAHNQRVSMGSLTLEKY